MRVIFKDDYTRVHILDCENKPVAEYVSDNYPDISTLTIARLAQSKTCNSRNSLMVTAQLLIGWRVA